MWQERSKEAKRTLPSMEKQAGNLLEEGWTAAESAKVFSLFMNPYSDKITGVGILKLYSIRDCGANSKESWSCPNVDLFGRRLRTKVIKCIWDEKIDILDLFLGTLPQICTRLTSVVWSQRAGGENTHSKDRNGSLFVPEADIHGESKTFHAWSSFLTSGILISNKSFWM